MLKRLFAFLILSALLIPAAKAQLTIRSQGTFTDTEKTVHRWYVNAAHTLIWDDKPFVPVGGMFQAKSWTANATDEDFKADVAALELLQAHGITDIYVQPAKGGLTALKPAQIQRLTDYLDTHNFTYGISLNDGPRDPLIGYVVRPGAFRQVAPTGGGEVKFLVPNVVSALYFVVSTSGKDIQAQGEATIDGNILRVQTKPSIADPNNQMVVLTVPERVYTPGGSITGGDIAMRNLWEGFDNYRDSVITTLSAVHFGKGFRFICDPLPENLALNDTFARFIPNSDAFRAEWSAYLSKKYRSLPNVIQSWAILEPNVKSFDDIANLIPLWSGGKGIANFYYPRTKDRLRVESVRSTFWNDLAKFKAESVQGYMNDLAVTLKRTVADVPIVYRNGSGQGWNELFTALPPSRGFDGMGIVAFGRGSDLSTHSAAYTFAQASESPKTIWLPVLGTADTPYTTRKPTRGYDSKIALSSSFDWLRDAGAKGFFLSGVRVVDPVHASFDLLSVPEQLDWLHDYAAILDRTGMRTQAQSAGAAQAPSAVFYPRHEIPDLSPVILTTGGGWWLPTSRAGQFYYYGVTGRAYGIDEPGVGMVYYLWNPKEKRRISMNVPKTALNDKTGNRVAWSSNAQGEINKQTLSLTIGPEPIRLLNYPIVPVPLEAFPEARAEALGLIKTATEMKSEDAGRYTLNLGQIHYNKENPYPGLSEMLTYLARLRNERAQYLWFDAEFTSSHSFDEISDHPGASGNRVLRVDARLDESPAIAQYTINLGGEKNREVWVAMSPDALVSLRLDGHPLVNEATIPQKVGNLYADSSLVWTRFGTATFTKGSHVLEIRADGPALIDTILLTRDPFTPDGPNPPPVLP